MTNSSVNPKCVQCSSELIFVSKETVHLEGTRYPQTTTVYRCSNIICQQRKDKEKADRQKIRQNRESTEQARMVKIQEKRALGKKAKIQVN